MVFVETIANPTQVPGPPGSDWCRLGAAEARPMVYVADNTIPLGAVPAQGAGAHLVVNSLTTSIATATLGAVTDTGLFDWSDYPAIFPKSPQGDNPAGGSQQLPARKGLRDMGATRAVLGRCAPHQRGRETLALGIERQKHHRAHAGARRIRPWDRGALPLPGLRTCSVRVRARVVRGGLLADDELGIRSRLVP